MNNIFYIIGICSLVLLQGCKDFLTVDLPKDQLNRANVFTDKSTAHTALNGMYGLTQQFGGGRMFTGGLTIYPGMYADELYYFTASNRDEFLESNLTQQNDGTLAAFWIEGYQYIYAANSCIEGALDSNLDEGVKNTIIGEAYFMRSLVYYYLTELFGDVPLVLSTDYRKSGTMARAAKQDVVKKILTDLQDASHLLEAEYRDGVKNSPNRYAVQALAARVALQNGEDQLAFDHADAIIRSDIYELESELSKVFLRESKETIFQLTRINQLFNTWESTFFVPANSSSSPAYVLQQDLVHSFAPTDKRRSAWIEGRLYSGEQLYHPTKYKARTTVLTEDYVLFRLAEQYLIRAEAALRLDRPDLAIVDLNKIRSRSGLEKLALDTLVADLWKLLLTERRQELFAELGYRWFDLKRLGKADEVLGALKPKWKSTAVHWMIPWSQIRKNPLLTQNEGYE
ncbi:RagB/SusD family nutrient uptake outer membrane protein [Sphingobacterium faecale]|uniref:RagB/SusD family nutrient uptake outer membrane protein n=1 Tax=Sphingobacterium faecale TaxID=2803775 RepID=A0ABS1R2S1_9SPHI|nr:RagB/SusD family nutrient uptake outer membrane protein [Sphingobacterium faecale]MBL1409009.1 RagB/SusD family nutrient uptake outer membrane protein [Sphingobacterium faecale]